MLSSSYQIVTIKWLDELAHIVSFLILITLSKIKLKQGWMYSPTSFQGWQTLCSFMVFCCLLIHPRIRSEVKILDRFTFILTLPVSVSYAVVIAAGANALSVFPIPVCLAWLNICPAVLIFLTAKSKSLGSSGFLGGVAVCLSVVIIYFFDCLEARKKFYVYLLTQVAITIAQSVYVRRINLQITDFTLIFYNIFISLIALLPVSIYHALEIHINFNDILPCLVTGILDLAFQIFSFRIKAKHSKYFIVQGITQFLIIILCSYIFDDIASPWIWSMVVVNWFITTLILNLNEEDVDKNSQFILVVPHVTKKMYVEKYINYNDMA